MTLLTIARNIAVNVGVDVPSEVKSSAEPSAVKIVRFTEEAGEEIARRANWGALKKTATITGTGTNDLFTIAADFARVIPGTAINSNGSVVRTGLSADEWNSLPPSTGTPRYARLEGASIAFWPYLANAQEAVVTYQSLNWCAGGTAWAADGDFALVPETLVEKGALWRWRRQLGADYQDQMAEYETALADLARSDDAMRQP
jgi:hypothetical protein